MRHFLLASIIGMILPATAIAHPHDDKAAKPEQQTDAEKNRARIESFAKSKAHLENRTTLPANKRVVVIKEGSDTLKLKTNDDGDTQIIDLGDGMSAKIHGEDVTILHGGKPIKESAQDDQTIQVDKSITIKDGRKKTKIIIKLDAPAE